MKYNTDDLYAEVQDVKATLAEVQDELRRFMEHSNREHIEDIVSNLRSELSSAVAAHLTQDAEKCLQQGMVSDCHMHATCKARFTELLSANAALLTEGTVWGDAIADSRSTLHGMREKAPFPRCMQCFTETEKLLDDQIAVMRSMRIYRDERLEKDALLTLPEGDAVQQILEPLANRQRLQILKALAGATETFSRLSELTGLRGGNLLFHLSKLLTSGMILQRNERGDYMITERGYTTLQGIADLYALANAPLHPIPDVLACEPKL